MYIVQVGDLKNLLKLVCEELKERLLQYPQKHLFTFCNKKVNYFDIIQNEWAND